MDGNVPFKIPTEATSRQLSNIHHLQFVKSDSVYRSRPVINISPFTKPKDTFNVRDGQCMYNAVCYSISGSERSSKKIRLVAADELLENGAKYEFIPNDIVAALERETRNLKQNNWGAEYQLIDCTIWKITDSDICF